MSAPWSHFRVTQWNIGLYIYEILPDQNTFPKKNSTEQSLQINKNMHLCPQGFVAFFSESWIIIFYSRQQEGHILNRSSTLISN